MSLRKDLLKQVVAWCEELLDITASGHSPQVILEQREEKGPRPSLPYLTVTFTSWDIPIGTVERQFEDETKNLGGHRMAVLRIKALGAGSDEWLQELGFRVDSFVGDMTIIADETSTMLDVSMQVNESYEEQYLRDFPCEYHLRGSETYPTADQTTLTVGDTAETFTFTTVIDWE